MNVPLDLEIAVRRIATTSVRIAARRLLVLPRHTDRLLGLLRLRDELVGHPIYVAGVEGVVEAVRADLLRSLRRDVPARLGNVIAASPLLSRRRRTA